MQGFVFQRSTRGGDSGEDRLAFLACHLDLNEPTSLPVPCSRTLKQSLVTTKADQKRAARGQERGISPIDVHSQEAQYRFWVLPYKGGRIIGYG